MEIIFYIVVGVIAGALIAYLITKSGLTVHTRKNY